MKKKPIHKITTTFVMTFALIVFGTTIGNAAPGDLDPTFGVGGKIVDPAGLATGVVVQPDGKIVVAGSAGSGFLGARYNPDGSPDALFGNNGHVITNFGGNTIGAYAVAIQADGKIVAGGYSCPCDDYGDAAFALVRYYPDGSLDASFDGDGMVTTTIGYRSTGYAIAIQPDNKVIVAGWSWGPEPPYIKDRFALARYNTDGSLDTTFDDDGTVTTTICGNCNDEILSIALQPDGKIVAVGGGFDATFSTKFVALRYNHDGSLDTAFGDHGIMLIGTGGFATSVATQEDGKIVVAGLYWNGSIPLLRLNSNGFLDTTFDLDGKVTTTGVYRSRLAIQPNGKIVVATEIYKGSALDLKLTRYNSDGSLDTAFGGENGETIVDIGVEFSGIALDRKGRLVVVGNGGVGFGIARFRLDSIGAVADFDGDGKSDVSVFRPSDRVWYLNNSQTGFSATQFGSSSDQITPGDFDGDGKTDIAVWRPTTGTWYIQQSTSGFTSIQLGLSKDLPVPGDYDGDGKTDIAVWRPSNGVWFVIYSGNGQSAGLQFGVNGDKPVSGDYDGDGKTDLAVYRPSGGTWYLMQSSNGFSALQFGLSTDKLEPADYDGDGKTDIAVYRDGTWYLQQSTAGFAAMQFGAVDDIPVPADYDGDGKADVSVWRPSNGIWYEQRGPSGFFATQFGLAGDKPIPASYVPMQ